MDHVVAGVTDTPSTSNGTKVLSKNAKKRVLRIENNKKDVVDSTLTKLLNETIEDGDSSEDEEFDPDQIDAQHSTNSSIEDDDDDEFFDSDEEIEIKWPTKRTASVALKQKKVPLVLNPDALPLLSKKIKKDNVPLKKVAKGKALKNDIPLEQLLLGTFDESDSNDETFNISSVDSSLNSSSDAVSTPSPIKTKKNKKNLVNLVKLQSVSSPEIETKNKKLAKPVNGGIQKRTKKPEKKSNVTAIKPEKKKLLAAELIKSENIKKVKAGDLKKKFKKR